MADDRPMRVEVDGIRAFQRALKKLDETEIPKAIQSANKEFADTVRDDARGLAPQGPSGKLRASIVSRATKTTASIRGGGARVPYFKFIDFGGSVGPGHKPRQPNSGSIKRPFLRDGRIMYPAARRHRPEALAKYESALRDAIKNSGL